MRLLVAIISLAVLAICPQCKKESPSQHDVVLEVAASMNTVFDTHIIRGRELYGRYCAVCHGVGGQGDGFNAFNLTPRPRNFTDSAFVVRMDTTTIMETIAGGGGAVGLSPLMPKWGHTLSKSDIRELTNYIVYLSERESLSGQGGK